MPTKQFSLEHFSKAGDYFKLKRYVKSQKVRRKELQNVGALHEVSCNCLFKKYSQTKREHQR